MGIRTGTVRVSILVILVFVCGCTTNSDYIFERLALFDEKRLSNSEVKLLKSDILMSKLPYRQRIFIVSCMNSAENIFTEEERNCSEGKEEI